MKENYLLETLRNYFMIVYRQIKVNESWLAQLVWWSFRISEVKKNLIRAKVTNCWILPVVSFSCWRCMFEFTLGSWNSLGLEPALLWTFRLRWTTFGKRMLRKWKVSFYVHVHTNIKDHLFGFRIASVWG